jgi:hypothetical protein
MTSIAGKLHKDQFTFLIISRSILLRLRHVSDKFSEEIKTHIVFRNFLFENRAVYEIMWKNTLESGRPQMTVWRMRIAGWVHKVKNTH